ncbi:MAG: GSCFA domain-containing protein [Pseudomonadota bacterium]
MPITRLSATDAVAQAKSNANARWPQRGTSPRLGSMAEPAFKAGCTLPQGGRIFTIGSCFARNVEKALDAEGFHLPALDLLENAEEFKSLGRGVLNNYGAPSILNELKWAFDEGSADAANEEAQFCRMGSGWVDLHLLNTMRPDTLDVVRMRRRALRNAYRSITECDAVIITLGLSEVWFDTQTGFYLNMAPRRALMRDYPDRFELHVLNHAETLAPLQDAIDLIFKHGKPGIQVILTVSPVPLTATYRDCDVMVANAYSKSVLRTVAEEITMQHEHVHYFPSYESITLSARHVAYDADEIHVTQPIVDLNVGRMIDAYLDRADDRPRDAADALAVELEADAEAVFDRFSATKSDFLSPAVAAVMAEAALDHKRYDIAAQVLAYAEDPAGLLEAEFHMAHARPDFALEALHLSPAAQSQTPLGKGVDPISGRPNPKAMRLGLRAHLAMGRYDAATDLVEAWSATAPRWIKPFQTLAQELVLRDDERATHWFERAIELSQDDPKLVIDLAQFFIDRNETAKARQTLSVIEAGSDQIMAKKEHLLRAC